MPAIAALALLAAGVDEAQAQKAPPYWASISAGKARMRSGPGRNFPATWLYQRAGLPVKVLEIYPNWRKVEDPDGTQGWMLVNLLSEERTAMVIGDIRELRATPDAAAKVVWRVEPGVVGTLRRCADGWCELNVGGRRGYIRTAELWGVDSGESLP